MHVNNVFFYSSRSVRRLLCHSFALFHECSHILLFVIFISFDSHVRECFLFFSFFISPVENEIFSFFSLRFIFDFCSVQFFLVIFLSFVFFSDNRFDQNIHLFFCSSQIRLPIKIFVCRAKWKAKEKCKPISLLFLPFLVKFFYLLLLFYTSIKNVQINKRLPSFECIQMYQIKPKRGREKKNATKKYSQSFVLCCLRFVLNDISCVV